jgi:DNA-damage-inducible protein J
MKEVVVRARVHSDLKEDAEKVFEKLGINTTEAIRMFLSQVRLRGGLPFPVEVPRNEDLLTPNRMRQAVLDSIDDDCHEILCQGSNMKAPDYSQKPTKDEIRAARMAGFKASIRHLSLGKQDRMVMTYQAKLDRLTH